MHLRRVTTHLPLLVLLALAGILLPATVAHAKPAGQGPCVKLTDPQTRTVEFRYLFQQTRQRKGTRSDGSAWPVQVLKEQRGSVGSLSFTAAACKRPENKGWKLVTPQTLSYRSTGAQTDQADLPLGVRDAATEGPRSFLSMRMMTCTKGALFAGMKLVVGLIPLPQLKQASGIAKWALGKAIPDDKIKCGDFGTVDLNVSVAPDGRVDVSPNTTNTELNQYVKPRKDFKLAWTYSITDPVVR